MRGLIFLGVISLAALGSGASGKSLSSCLTVENDLDRLACYDKTTGRTLSVEKQDAPVSAR